MAQQTGSGSGGSGGIATNGTTIEGGSSSSSSSSSGGSSSGGNSNGTTTTTSASDRVRSEGCVGSAVYQFDRANNAIEPDYHPTLEDSNINNTSPAIRQVCGCSGCNILPPYYPTTLPLYYLTILLSYHYTTLLSYSNLPIL